MSETSPTKPSISDQDYADCAADLGCKVAAIKAVASVESSGYGFLPTGELVILFEPHIFWRQLVRQRVDPKTVLSKNPEMLDILYEVYKGHAGEHPSQQWDRLRRAAQVNMNAAYNSTSFGKFQIMGFNAEAAGYKNVFEFVHYLDEGEKFHLLAFGKLIKSFGLAEALANENWAAFAKSYNGPAYKGNPDTIKDDYDYKLAQAFNKFST
jgi:hypothetical protein